MARMKRVNPDTEVEFTIKVPKVTRYNGDAEHAEHFLIAEDGNQALLFHTGDSACDWWEICSVNVDVNGAKGYHSIPSKTQFEFYVNDD